MSTQPQNNFLFRFDAGPGTGFGHLKRTLVLVQALRSLTTTPFYFLTRTPKYVKKYVARYGKVIILKKELDGANREIPQGNNLLVIDRYGFSSAQLRKMRKAGCKIVLLDDCGNLSSYPVDMILNYHPYAGALKYQRKSRSGTRLLLGPRYAPIAGEVFYPEKKRLKNKAIYFTLGGSASQNVFEKMRGMLLKSGWKILAASGKIARVDRLMKRSGIAVASSGVSAYELAAMGIPTIYIVMADNQKNVATSMSKLGAGINLGPVQKVSERKLCNAVKCLQKNPAILKKMSRVGMNLIDGRGACRAARAILKLFN